MPPVPILGLAGDLAAPDGNGDHYATRIGGLPAWPYWAGAVSPPPPPALLRCRACGGPLLQVLQAYAPLSLLNEGVDAPERVLYVSRGSKEGLISTPSEWGQLSFSQRLVSSPPPHPR